MDRKSSDDSFSAPVRRRGVLSLMSATACGFAAAPAAAMSSPALEAKRNNETIKRFLAFPDSALDLTQVKATMDAMVDASLTPFVTVARIDAMADDLRKFLPLNAPSRLTLDALRFHLYQPSPWNSNRPFSYDLDDPFGDKVRNKTLAVYIATRKGNCVSMPLLFILLGQRLGIDVTAAEAPNHLFVKYRDPDGKTYNLEATSGAGFSRDVWIRQQSPMTDKAIASGIYMRPLAKGEMVPLMAEMVLEQYGQQGLQESRIDLSLLLLAKNPKDVSAILHQRSAYHAIWQRDFVARYRSPGDIPPMERPRLAQVEGKLQELYDSAYALGWRPLDDQSEQRYQRTVERAKQASRGEK